MLLSGLVALGGAVLAFGGGLAIFSQVPAVEVEFRNREVYAMLLVMGAVLIVLAILPDPPELRLIPRKVTE